MIMAPTEDIKLILISYNIITVKVKVSSERQGQGPGVTSLDQ
jgi:hypothetical protein